MKVYSNAKIERLRNSGLNIYQIEELENKVYLGMKFKLGLLDTSIDPYPDPFTNKTSKDLEYGSEELSQILLNITTKVLIYLGKGLFFLSSKIFKYIRNKSLKVFNNYPGMVLEWKSSVWRNAREIDGQLFDAYKVKVVSHADMIKRIQVVETIHKTLSSIDSIYNHKVNPSSDEWTTYECEKIIRLLEEVGFGSRQLDVKNNLSKRYVDARKSQPLYLHGYTPKRILALITRCEKLANYGDTKYIDNFEKKYLKCTENLESYEADTSYRVGTNTNEKKSEKIEKERDHIAKIRAARLWWLAHFLKASYTITSDILKDAETLANATGKCIAKNSY